MKKVLLTLVAVFALCSVKAQTLFSENFNAMTGAASLSAAGWTTYSDNLTNHSNYSSINTSWDIVNFSNEYGVAAVSISYTNQTQDCDRWLITPAITIPDSGYAANFLTWGYTTGQYAEKVNVMISTTSTDKSAFTSVVDKTPHPASWDESLISLDAYVGQTIYIAFVNHGDGYYCALDNFSIKVPDQNAITLTELTIPTYNPINQNNNVTGVIINKGLAPLTEFDVDYTVNGVAAGVSHISGINVAYGQTYNFTHSIPFNLADEGTANITVTVSNPNGSTDENGENDNVLSTSVKMYDAVYAVNRTVLLEEFTGNKCGYCPGGYTRIQQALPGHNAIMVAHHAGYNDDALTCNENKALTWYYNSSNGTYAPALMIDRARLDPSSPGPVMGVGTANDISAYLSEREAVPCFLNLNLSNVNFDEASRQVTGKISGQFTRPIYNANTRLQVYLVEDSFLMSQADYDQGITVQDYRHMHAVRASVVGDNWGVAVSPDAEGNFEYSINWNMPAKHKAWRCHLVALVFDYNASDANNSEVMQCTEAEHFTAQYVGLDEVACNVNLNIFPNPSTNFVNVEASDMIAEVSVVNALGQVVYTNNTVNGESIRINTQNFSNGIYMVTVKTAKGISTKRFTVAK